MPRTKLQPGQLSKLDAVVLLREYTWLEIAMTDRITKARRNKERKLVERILAAMANEPFTEDEIQHFLGQIG